jgi:hypothetical protein
VFSHTTNIEFNVSPVLVLIRVGKKVGNMSIDWAGGQYWLKPVKTGQYWSIENSLVNIGFFLSF